MSDLLTNTPAGRNYLALAENISDVVPSYLRELKRWTAWKLGAPKKPGAKPPKIPCSLTNDSRTWRTFPDAISESRGLAGIGFQMAGVSTLAAIDLDGCIDPTTGAISNFAVALLRALPGTYAERSPSGKGIRIFARVPEGLAVPEFLSAQHGVECYVGKSPRYLTVTGHVLEDARAGQLADMTPEAVRMLAPLAAASATGETVTEVRLPVPSVDRVENWQGIFDKRLGYTRLKKEWRTYLEEGALPGSRSETTFAVACKLIEARYRPEEVFAVLISAPGSWEAALDKRDQDVTRARALVWADIGRAQKIVAADESDIQERVGTWQDLGLTVKFEHKKAIVLGSQMNAMRTLEGHEEWRGRIALDVTSGYVLLDGTRLDDARFFSLQERVGRFLGWDPDGRRQWWTDVVRAVAERNPVNTREVELRSLVWDGTPRLDSWFVDHVAKEDCPLNRAIGRKWLLSLVARWVNPGCKVDTVLILQGFEGARKDTFFETIAGAPERVVNIDGVDREDKFLLARAWLAMMPEASLLRRADRNRLKGFITKPTDDYRLPYAPSPVTVRRAFVFVSTSNSPDLFNCDQDGLRRFWPVWVKKRVDYEWVAANRDQLLAEALLAYDLEEPWWFDETPDDLRERVEAAVEHTALDEAIEEYVRRRRAKGGTSLTEIVVELGAILGYRPNDRQVSTLLWKHGVVRKRTGDARYWMHDSWATGGDDAANVVPLRAPEKKSEPEAPSGT